MRKQTYLLQSVSWHHHCCYEQCLDSWHLIAALFEMPVLGESIDEDRQQRWRHGLHPFNDDYCMTASLQQQHQGFLGLPCQLWALGRAVGACQAWHVKVVQAVATAGV